MEPVTDQEQGQTPLSRAMDKRRASLGLTWKLVAARAGIDTETIRAVRKGLNVPSTLTQAGIEKALEWEPGSVATILAGGEPFELERQAGQMLIESLKADRQFMAAWNRLSPEQQKVALALAERFQRRVDEQEVQARDDLLTAVKGLAGPQGT